MTEIPLNEKSDYSHAAPFKMYQIRFCAFKSHLYSHRRANRTVSTKKGGIGRDRNNMRDVIFTRLLLENG